MNLRSLKLGMAWALAGLVVCGAVLVATSGRVPGAAVIPGWSTPWGYSLAELEPVPHDADQAHPAIQAWLKGPRSRLWRAREVGRTIGPPLEGIGTNQTCRYRVIRITGPANQTYWAFASYVDEDDGGEIQGFVLDNKAKRVGSVVCGFLRPP